MPIVRGPIIRRVVAVTLVVALTGCTEIGDPELGSVPGDEPQEVASPGVTSDIDTGPTQTVDTTPVFVPERPEGYVPDLIVATETGTGLLTPDGLSSLGEDITAQPIVSAYDDLFGGLVIQTNTGDVVWFSGGSPAGQKLEDVSGLLVDVGFSGGAGEVVVATSERTFDSYGLVNGERRQVGTLAEGESIRDVASGGGLYLVALADGNCGQLRFLNGAGETVSLGELEVSECAVDGADTFTSVAITPTGESYAYTQVGYRSDGVEESTEVVVVDAVTGASVAIPVGEADQHIASLTFDGTRIAFLRLGLTETEVVVIDISRPEEPSIQLFSTVSAVSFARLPLLVLS